MKKNRLYQILNSPLYISLFLFIILGYIALWPRIGYDEWLWIYIGKIWIENGIPPYVGAVENKTPGIFYIYALSGFFFKGSIFFTRILGVLAVIITTNFLYLITKKLHTRLSGIVCMYVFGLSMGWAFFDGLFFSQTETFMILFSTASFYAIICARNYEKSNRLVFISGISIGLAIAFKQIALTTLFALIIFFVIYTSKKNSIKSKLIGLILLSFGLFVATLFSILILYFNGVSFYEYIEGAWLILLNSGSKAPDLNTYINNFIRVFLSSRFTCFYPLLILFILQKRYLNHGLYIALLIWFILDFIGVNASGYFYGHQIKQLLPVLTIMTSIVFCRVLNENRFKIYSERLIIAIILLFFPYEQIMRGTYLLINYSPTKRMEVGYWLKNQTTPSDHVFMIGTDLKLVSALTMSDRVSSSRYFHSIFINGEKERQIVHSDLMTKPPKFILREENDTISIKKYGKRVEALVEKNYISIKTIDNVEILKRR